MLPEVENGRKKAKKREIGIFREKKDTPDSVL